MSHINFICEIAHAYQHMPAYFHYITQNHAYLPTHTRTWVPMMAQWPPLMRGHPFWEATFTQHLGWLLVRGFTVIPISPRGQWVKLTDPTVSNLTHWGRVTHICVSKLTIIGSDNGLLPGRHQAIIWTNAEILSIGPIGTNFSEISIKI